MATATEQAYSQETRTNGELVQAALATNEDDDAYWHTVAVLQYRGTSEALQIVEQLCGSTIARERALGANILGKLGETHLVHSKMAVRLLLDLVQDHNPNVLEAAVAALGHYDQDPRTLPELLRLRNHHQDRVRYYVAAGLSVQEKDEDAFAALIELTQDENILVRDWATFYLGNIGKRDTPALRDALVARLDDEDAETRGEAMIGLAKRKDPRLIEPLIRELSKPLEGDWGLEAAELMGDDALYPALLDLKERLLPEDSEWRKEWVEDALAACQPKA